MPESLRSEEATSGAERLTFFSDAVIAIAITLLALELPVPEELTGDSGEQMTEMITFFSAHADEYLAFLISFLVIAIHWSTHFRVFRQVRDVNARLIQLNLLWLLLIVITPFTTKIISLGENNPLRFAVYAGAQALQFTVFALLVLQLIKHKLMLTSHDPAQLRSTLRRVVPMAAAFAVSIPVYALAGRWAFVLWALVPIVTGRIDDLHLRRIRRGR
ncbi:TMEM175 family protein [Microlunatus sp. GCM10028923]|uniref:TMEM175 family protein n=1 Tax=Microlunatus sp. GCM10028923 TaxID=3273400 RepID=UPI00360CA96F